MFRGRGASNQSKCKIWRELNRRGEGSKKKIRTFTLLAKIADAEYGLRKALPRVLEPLRIDPEWNFKHIFVVMVGK